VWRAKCTHGLWRPITAINLADTDGNPATIADPTWTPLLTTPAYPEYPSGYNSLAATTTGSLEQLFHTQRLNLTLISTAVPNVTRHYDTGTAVRTDVVNARVWLGIHFRTADVASRNLGLQQSEVLHDPARCSRPGSPRVSTGVAESSSENRPRRAQ
jgi:hypothetical protein